MINENRVGLALNPWAVIVPAAADRAAHHRHQHADRRDRAGRARRGPQARGSRPRGRPGPGRVSDLNGAAPPARSGWRCATWRSGAAVTGPRSSARSASRCGPATCSAWSASPGPARPRSPWPCSATPGAACPSAGGEILLDGPDLLRLQPAGLRQAARGQGQLRAAGPVGGAEPGAADRLPAPRGAARARPGLAGDRREPDRWRCCPRSGWRPSPALLRRYPHQLSGGQQQRVALAMAFACRPALIVLDEPTTGLDVSTQRHILDTIRSLCRGYGVAAVYVSHDLAVVSELAAEVAVMYAGRIVEAGPAAPLFAPPAAPLHPGAARVRPGARSAAGRWPGLPGSSRRPATAGRGARSPPAAASRSTSAGPACRNRLWWPGAPCAACGRPRRTARPGHPVPAPARPARGPPAGPAPCSPSGGFRSITARCRSCPASIWTCRRGRASRWSASPARARRRWPAASSGCTGTGPAR